MEFLGELTRQTAIVAIILAFASLGVYLLSSFSSQVRLLRHFAAWVFFLCSWPIAARTVYLGIEWLELSSQGADQFFMSLVVSLGIVLAGAALLGIDVLRARFRHKAT